MPRTRQLTHRTILFAAGLALALCARASGGETAPGGSDVFPLPEDEPAALEEMKALVTRGDIGTASWLAKSVRKLGDADGVELLHARLWRQLAGELTQCAQYRKDDVHHVRYRARVAAALGLHDVAIQCRREVLAKTRGKGRDNDRWSDAKAAAMAAFRKRDFELAIELFGLVEEYGHPGGMEEYGRKMAAHVRELARAPEDIETRIRFATEALARRPPLYRYLADAIVLMRETLDLDPPPTLEQRKKVYALIEDFHRQKRGPYARQRDFAGAERWAMKAIEEFPDDRELRGAALVRTGADKHKQDDKAGALALFRRASEECAGTKSWPDAQFNVGFILAELGKHEDAIAAFEKVLAARVDNLARTREIMAPLKNYQHRSCKQIALAYEALGDYGSALKYHGLARTKYRFETFCGTCAKSEGERTQNHETLLGALEALGKPGDDEIARVAARFMRSRNGHAKRVLLRLGPAAAHALVKVAGDKDAAIRRDALGALLELGPDAAPAVPKLMELLRNDPEKDIRFRAAICLRTIGAPARESVPALLEGLAEKGSDVPQVALEALEAIGPTKEDLPLLLAALEKADGKMKGAIIGLMRGMGPKAASAVPVLIRLGPDEKLRLYSEASAALVAIGEAAVGPVLRAWEEAVEEAAEEDRFALRFLTETLGKLGPPARDAVPALADMTRDKELSGSAARALGRIGEPAVPALMRLLEDGDKTARPRVALALGEMGRAAAQAVPLLIRIADDDEKKYSRGTVIMALGKLAPYAPAATPVLVKKLGSPGDTYAAAKAFKELWPGAMEALPALERLASDTKRHHTRVAAQTAAGRLQAIRRIRARRAGGALSE